MKQILLYILPILLFIGCSKTPNVALSSLPKADDENYEEVLNSFINNCKTSKAETIYNKLCEEARQTTDARNFLHDNFTIERLNAEDSLLTGYYEPELQGSLTQSEKYPYPIYNTPKDLVVVDLTSVYPELTGYRLRGRLEGQKLIPYYRRDELQNTQINSEVICYCDSKIDLFFLEVQGSGRVNLDNGEVIYVGYDNQNGHPYKSIGKYLINQDEITQEDISLQSIKQWFKENPSKVDEVLNYNASIVFFAKREQGATGALGVELTPLRSVAVDKKYIALGSMLYLSASSDEVDFNRVVFAQDTGGAIRGGVRADMFLGFGQNAGKIAGKLKAPLKLWIFKPKKSVN